MFQPIPYFRENRSLDIFASHVSQMKLEIKHDANSAIIQKPKNITFFTEKVINILVISVATAQSHSLFMGSLDLLSEIIIAHVLQEINKTTNQLTLSSNQNLTSHI